MDVDLMGVVIVKCVFKKIILMFKIVYNNEFEWMKFVVVGVL